MALESQRRSFPTAVKGPPKGRKPLKTIGKKKHLLYLLSLSLTVVLLKIVQKSWLYDYFILFYWQVSKVYKCISSKLFYNLLWLQHQKANYTFLTTYL